MTRATVPLGRGYLTMTRAPTLMLFILCLLLSTALLLTPTLLATAVWSSPSGCDDGHILGKPKPHQSGVRWGFGAWGGSDGVGVASLDPDEGQGGSGSTLSVRERCTVVLELRQYGELPVALVHPVCVRLILEPGLPGVGPGGRELLGASLVPVLDVRVRFRERVVLHVGSSPWVLMSLSLEHHA